jgi:hypothetical protein
VRIFRVKDRYIYYLICNFSLSGVFDMPLRIGNRVTIRPLPKDHVFYKHTGKRGEIDGIKDNLYLVDDQLVNGVRQGRCTFREFFREEELELG